MKSTIYSQF